MLEFKVIYRDSKEETQICFVNGSDLGDAKQRFAELWPNNRFISATVSRRI